MRKINLHATLLAASIAVLSVMAAPQASALLQTPSRITRATKDVVAATWFQGPQPFLTILCKFADIPAEPQAPDHFADLLLGAAPSLDDYWREVSYGLISLRGTRVVGWYRMASGTAGYRNADGSADLLKAADGCLAAAGAEVLAQKYAGFNLVFNADLDSRPYGSACVKDPLSGECRRVTWIWPAAFHSLASWAHEMGHAFGLPHVPNSTGLQYGNTWTIMSDSASCREGEGRSPMPQHLSAHEKDLLGWIPGHRAFDMSADGSATVSLQRLAQPAADGYLLVTIPWPDGSGGYYTVEARRRAGYDIYLGGDAVVIHSVDPTASPYPAQLISHTGVPIRGVAATAWTPGDSFIDAKRSVAVTVEHDTPAGFVVTLRTGRAARGFTPPASPAPLAPTILASVPSGQAGTPGASMARTGDGTYFAWSGPAPSSGRPPYGLAPSDVWVARARGDEEAGQPIRVTTDGDVGAKTSPVLAADRAGNLFAAWISQKARGADVEFVQVGEEGKRGKIERINDRDDAAWRAEPALVAGPNGDLHAAWVDARSGRDQIYVASRRASAEWGPNERLSASTIDAEAAPALALDGEGNLYAAWVSYSPCDRGQGSLGAIMFTVRPAGGRWQAPVVLAGYVNGGREVRPALAADASGTVYAAWEAYEDRGVALYRARRTPGGEWSPKVLIDRAARHSLGRPTL
jgi:hypothetical protein